MLVTCKNITWESEYPSWCPKCDAPEMHPDQNVLLIRGYKIFEDDVWWSQCLVCAGYYDGELNLTGSEPDGGWFADRGDKAVR